MFSGKDRSYRPLFDETDGAFGEDTDLDYPTFDTYDNASPKWGGDEQTTDETHGVISKFAKKFAQRIGIGSPEEEEAPVEAHPAPEGESMADLLQHLKEGDTDERKVQKVTSRMSRYGQSVTPAPESSFNAMKPAPAMPEPTDESERLRLLIERLHQRAGPNGSFV